MRVSELSEGMLIRPKRGFVFRLYTGSNYRDSFMQLECHKRLSALKSLGTSPVVYIGKAPKADPSHTYESRHSVFVTIIGKKLRVAPEAWRNMEAINNE
jgi:hypothetical protein